MVQKMLSGRSANSVAQEAGVKQPTLSKWLRDARTLRGVAKRKLSERLERTERRHTGTERKEAEEKLTFKIRG